MTYWAYDFSKVILRLYFRFGFGLELLGSAHVPPSGPFILASNHVSFLDPPLLGAACPRRLRFMARADLFDHPLLGAYLRGVHVVPLKRGESDLGAIHHAIRLLHDGEVLAIFPEGGRQRSGRLGFAKRGVGLLAETARVPIVPVLVQGTFEAWPPEATRPRRTKIRVAFGPAIPYTVGPALALGVSTPESKRPEAGARVSRARHERLADAVTSAWRQLAQQLAATS